MTGKSVLHETQLHDVTSGLGRNVLCEQKGWNRGSL